VLQGMSIEGSSRLTSLTFFSQCGQVGHIARNCPTQSGGYGGGYQNQRGGGYGGGRGGYGGGGQVGLPLYAVAMFSRMLTSLFRLATHVAVLATCPGIAPRARSATTAERLVTSQGTAHRPLLRESATAASNLVTSSPLAPTEAHRS